MITNLVYEALIKEVELTPKPGLVDKNNSGSHSDMDIDTFYTSAKAIKPFISMFLECGSDFEALRRVGLECEKAMFKATKGVNTHKGMIFSLAVICGAIGSVGFTCKDTLQDEIRFTCKDVIEEDLDNLQSAKTHGEKFFLETKSLGIRGEASQGYPTVFEKALPFYMEKKKEHAEEIALKYTLLYLISETEDSTLYARGGLEALRWAQNEAKKLLHVNAHELDKKLLAFDTAMIEKNLSAGGSADLLGLTWFLANF